LIPILFTKQNTVEPRVTAFEKPWFNLVLSFGDLPFSPSLLVGEGQDGGVLYPFFQADVSPPPWPSPIDGEGNKV